MLPGMRNEIVVIVDCFSVGWTGSTAGPAGRFRLRVDKFSSWFHFDVEMML